MLNLYKVSTQIESGNKILTEQEEFSLIYHNIFDYPLDFADLVKWKAGKSITNIKINTCITSKKNFYYIDGREGLIYKRLLRRRISAKKMSIAKKASTILSILPTVKMVAITGSLAMENSSEDSDIDLMIVTSKNTLWLSRLVILVILKLLLMPTRRSQEREQKDRLCLNMWLDESDLIWEKPNRNIYTAHEIAQVVPLVNKDKTFERFLSINRWILKYWPNSVKIRNPNIEILDNFEYSKIKILKIVSDLVLRTSNLIAFKMQYLYMKSKITREVVTPTRALFHPQDWGKVILSRLSK